MSDVARKTWAATLPLYEEDGEIVTYGGISGEWKTPDGQPYSAFIQLPKFQVEQMGNPERLIVAVCPWESSDEGMTLEVNVVAVADLPERVQK